MIAEKRQLFFSQRNSLRLSATMRGASGGSSLPQQLHDPAVYNVP